MKKAYLSVDLDFWTDYENHRSADRFFNRVLSLNVPILFVIEHEELLQDINQSKLDILYNVDYHSDLCTIEDRREEKGPSDGTWASYVRWRRNGHFQWIYPNYKKCYYEAGGLCHGECNPFEYTSKTEWKQATHTPKITSIDWRRVKQVGVCLSPLFVNLDTVYTVLSKFDFDFQEVMNLCCKQSMHPSRRKRGVLFKKVA